MSAEKTEGRRIVSIGGALRKIVVPDDERSYTSKELEAFAAEQWPKDTANVRKARFWRRMERAGLIGSLACSVLLSLLLIIVIGKALIELSSSMPA